MSHNAGTEFDTLIEKNTGTSDVAQGVPSLPFNPARSWLVVEMEAAREKKGLLYVPDTAKDAPQVGHVLAAGPGEPDGPPMVTKVGDRILFAKYSGAEIDWTDDKTYLFVKESDVISYVKEA